MLPCLLTLLVIWSVLRFAEYSTTTFARCNLPVDSWGIHGFKRPFARIHINDGIVREVAAFLKAAGAQVVVEPVHMAHVGSRSPVNRQAAIYRPHIVIEGLDGTGCRTEIDVTTIDPTAASYLKAAETKLRAAADLAERRKVRNYADKIDGRYTQFIPAAVEFGGLWGRGMVSLFAKGVHLAVEMKKDDGGFFRGYWKARLSTAFRRILFQKAHYFMRKDWPQGGSTCG